MYHSSMARTLLKWVGWTNVIKQSCQFQNQKISSELSDDIDFFGDTIARGDGRVQAHKRSLGSCSPFIQLVLPEKLLRIMKDDINVTFWGWSRACKHTQLLLGSNVHGHEGLSLHWRLLHKTDKMHCVTMIDLYMVMVFVDAFENIVTQVTVNVYCCVTVTVTYSSWFALIW